MGDKAKFDNEPTMPAPGNPPPYTSGPPPGPGGPPGPYGPPGPTHVVMAQPAVVHTTVAANVVPVMVTQVGPKPTRLVCKSCNVEIVTRVEPKTAMKTHICAGILCLFGCWCCVCIPYCTDSCRNMDHYCPNCNSYVGGYFL